MVPQIDVVLSKVSRSDPLVLLILDELKHGITSPDEARGKLFGNIPAEASLYCFFLLYRMGEETVRLAVDELKSSKGKLELARGDIMSAIEEWCSAFKEKAVMEKREKYIRFKPGKNKKAA